MAERVRRSWKVVDSEEYSESDSFVPNTQVDIPSYQDKSRSEENADVGVVGKVPEKDHGRDVLVSDSDREATEKPPNLPESPTTPARNHPSLPSSRNNTLAQQSFAFIASSQVTTPVPSRAAQSNSVESSKITAASSTGIAHGPVPVQTPDKVNLRHTAVAERYVGNRVPRNTKKNSLTAIKLFFNFVH